MIVGSLGDIVFQVSTGTILTVQSMTWSGSANIEEHARVGYHALTEFCGMGADTMELEITLSQYLGADPMTEIAEIWRYERNGTPVTLVLGDHAYGKYKWLVESHKTKAQYFDADGNLAQATVTVKLIEYINW
ncbi:MAG: phage tail protein [Oscillospiraceae bacterium]|nr:phage tail protein [Oscillospiraceae bacterium]